MIPNLILQVSIDVASLLIAFLIIIIIVSFLSASIKIVREYQRIVVFRLGRAIGVKGPGVVLLIPIIDRPVFVDLRERYLEITKQTCITKDNAPVDIDFLIYFRVFDPLQSVINVQNFEGAATGIATTTLRAVIGDINLDDVLARREEINKILRGKLDEVTERWGVKVTSVEIREIMPPNEVQDAMIRQMSAERNRRAMVTEASGQKESAILVAEGEKQSAILKAEGERQAAILKAQGYAQALEILFNVAKNLDSKTMALQYMEMLKEIGRGESTKFVLPMEFTKFVEDISKFIKEMTGEEEKES
jgi:regulator of protease activity HflC (stomatin/prohibitin superfamily)